MLSACFKSGHVARVFDGRALHAQANPKERNFVFARVLNGVNHSLNAALAESAGNQNAVDIAQARRRGFARIDFFGFDPFENGFVLVRQAAVEQRFAQTFVRIFELHVFSDHRDAHFALRDAADVASRSSHGCIFARRCFQFQQAQNLLVQSLRCASATGTA